MKKISTCKLFQRKQFFILISSHIKWLMISLCQKLAPINKQKAKQVSLQTEKSKKVSIKKKEPSYSMYFLKTHTMIIVEQYVHAIVIHKLSYLIGQTSA